MAFLFLLWPLRLHREGQFANVGFRFLEFKEIRKEWKARKKEEEAQRKAAEERARAASTSQSTQSTDNNSYAARGAVQLPPIGSNTPVSQYPLPEYNGPAYQNYPPGSGSPYHPNGYSTAQRK